MRAALRSLAAFYWHRELPVPARLACLLSALLPVIYVLGSGAADAALSVVSLLFLAESRRSGNWAWLRAPWVRAALLLWAYLLLRSLFAESIPDALNRALPWGRFPLFAAALAYLGLPYAPARRALFASLAASLAFVLGDCLLQYAVGYDLFGHAPVATESGAPRLTGPFNAPKAGIILAWLAFPVLTALWQGRAEHCRHSLAGMALAFFFLVAVFLTGERMALLLTAFGMALLFLLSAPIRAQLAAAGVAGMAAIALLVSFNPALLARQYSSTVATAGEVESSAYGMIWQSALHMAKDHPLFGVGLRHFRIACPDPAYGPTDAETLALRCNLHPHNLYLEWLLETGAAGLGLFLWLMARILRPAVARWRELRAQPIFLGLMVALAIRLWPLSTSTSFFVSWSAIPFWLYAGWLLAVTEERE